jgi:hypothetical protein
MTVDARDALEYRLGIVSFEDEFPGGSKGEPARIQRSSHSGQFNERRREGTKTRR